MKNMALAHEIAMDKNFKLQKFEPENSLQSKVKEIMHKAFWDVLASRLNEDPPDYTQALVLLEEIKEVKTEFQTLVFLPFCTENVLYGNELFVCF